MRSRNLKQWAMNKTSLYHFPIEKTHPHFLTLPNEHLIIILIQKAIACFWKFEKEMTNTGHPPILMGYDS